MHALEYLRGVFVPVSLRLGSLLALFRVGCLIVPLIHLIKIWGSQRPYFPFISLLKNKKTREPFICWLSRVNIKARDGLISVYRRVTGFCGLCLFLAVPAGCPSLFSASFISLFFAYFPFYFPFFIYSRSSSLINSCLFSCCASSSLIVLWIIDKK